MFLEIIVLAILSSTKKLKLKAAINSLKLNCKKRIGCTLISCVVARNSLLQSYYPRVQFQRYYT